MKFAEMPYQRVDTDAVVAGLKELTQELKAAKSGEEQFAIHQKFYELRDEYSTMIQIAMIRSDVDTADAFYLSLIHIFCWQETLANLGKARGVGKNIKQEKSMWILC